MEWHAAVSVKSRQNGNGLNIISLLMAFSIWQVLAKLAYGLLYTSKFEFTKVGQTHTYYKIHLKIAMKHLSTITNAVFAVHLYYRNHIVRNESKVAWAFSFTWPCKPFLTLWPFFNLLRCNSWLLFVVKFFSCKKKLWDKLQKTTFVFG